uniref:Uncharacterized protein n=1 Tax=Timema tahoe TaxID=61484 RepID=A0A7R9IKS1_9NEOP|nr:unnamed protein product [Timema tahoe]
MFYSGPLVLSGRLGVRRAPGPRFLGHRAKLRLYFPSVALHHPRDKTQQLSAAALTTTSSVEQRSSVQEGRLDQHSKEDITRLVQEEQTFLRARVPFVDNFHRLSFVYLCGYRYVLAPTRLDGPSAELGLIASQKQVRLFATGPRGLSRRVHQVPVGAATRAQGTRFNSSAGTTWKSDRPFANYTIEADERLSRPGASKNIKHDKDMRSVSLTTHTLCSVCLLASRRGGPRGC